jgi:hypothetical protein
MASAELAFLFPKICQNSRKLIKVVQNGAKQLTNSGKSLTNRGKSLTVEIACPGLRSPEVARALTFVAYSGLKFIPGGYFVPQ